MGEHVDLTPELLVRAYRMGAFPMARSRGGPIDWYSPDPRAVLPLETDAFHLPKSLAKRVRSGRYRITRDQAFERVIRACAEPAPGRWETWISSQIIDAYCDLHRQGLAHSVEAWAGEMELVGGLYGVTLGGAFFGESMFWRKSDASKVCLVYLVEYLRARGFVLLDVQFVNPHLVQFGVEQIARQTYRRRLEGALKLEVTW